MNSVSIQSILFVAHCAAPFEPPITKFEVPDVIIDDDEIYQAVEKYCLDEEFLIAYENSDYQKMYDLKMKGADVDHGLPLKQELTPSIFCVEMFDFNMICFLLSLGCTLGTEDEKEYLVFYGEDKLFGETPFGFFVNSMIHRNTLERNK